MSKNYNKFKVGKSTPSKSKGSLVTSLPSVTVQGTSATISTNASSYVYFNTSSASAGYKLKTNNCPFLSADAKQKGIRIYHNKLIGSFTGASVNWTVADNVSNVSITATLVNWKSFMQSDFFAVIKGKKFPLFKLLFASSLLTWLTLIGIILLK